MACLSPSIGADARALSYARIATRRPGSSGETDGREIVTNWVRHIATLTAAATAFLAAPIANADPVADFYSGKTITLLIGFGPGGGYDTYARVLARHFSKHIPGNPGIVPQNMPGSGGVKVANYMYNAAPKNGTYLQMIATSAALEPLFGNKVAKYDPTKFSWIGNMDKDTASCGVWQSAGIRKFSDMLTKEVVFGATGPSASTGQHALVLRNMLGAKVKLITGYKGTKEINLAMERGEVGATCGMFLSSVKSDFDADVKSGKLKIIIQFGRTNEPYFGDAANIYDLLKTDEEKATADIIFQQSEITRPVGGTPGVPAERTAALRKAFVETMSDPGLMADATKIRIDIRPMTGEQLSAAFASFYKAPPEVLKKAIAATSR